MKEFLGNDTINPSPQALSITSSNDDDLVWDLQDNMAWLRTDQINGTTPATFNANVESHGVNLGLSLFASL